MIWAVCAHALRLVRSYGALTRCGLPGRTDTARKPAMDATCEQLTIRLLSPGDVATVRAVFNGLSSHSRHLRFHSPTPKLTRSMERLLTSVDGERHVAVVAEAEGAAGAQPIGIAHLVITGDAVAEVAFAVVDAWQGRGVGRRLLSSLRRRAGDLGVGTVVASVLQHNHAAAALVRSVFGAVTARRSGMTVELTASALGDAGDAGIAPAPAECALAA